MDQRPGFKAAISSSIRVLDVVVTPDPALSHDPKEGVFSKNTTKMVNVPEVLLDFVQHQAMPSTFFSRRLGDVAGFRLVVCTSLLQACLWLRFCRRVSPRIFVIT